VGKDHGCCRAGVDLHRIQDVAQLHGEDAELKVMGKPQEQLSKEVDPLGREDFC